MSESHPPKEPVPAFAPLRDEDLAAPIRVSIASDVLRLIHRHAHSSISTEVCGVLIGAEREGSTSIHAAIEGVNASQGGAHVTFTQDTWEHVYAVKDKQFPDDRIVGWYHSHPGFGIFLSQQDLFIHENFFSSPGQVAWVYDPRSEEEGCFGWVDGKIQRLRTIRVVDSSPAGAPVVGEEPEAEGDDTGVRAAEAKPKASKGVSKLTKRLVLLFCLLLMFVAGVAAGLFVLPRNIVMYSLPDGRLLTPDEVQRALERDLQRRRDWIQQQGDGQGGQKAPAPGEAAPAGAPKP